MKPKSGSDKRIFYFPVEFEILPGFNEMFIDFSNFCLLLYFLAFFSGYIFDLFYRKKYYNFIYFYLIIIIFSFILISDIYIQNKIKKFMELKNKIKIHENGDINYFTYVDLSIFIAYLYGFKIQAFFVEKILIRALMRSGLYNFGNTRAIFDSVGISIFIGIFIYLFNKRKCFGILAKKTVFMKEYIFYALPYSILACIGLSFKGNPSTPFLDLNIRECLFAIGGGGIFLCRVLMAWWDPSPSFLSTSILEFLGIFLVSCFSILLMRGGLDRWKGFKRFAFIYFGVLLANYTLSASFY